MASEFQERIDSGTRHSQGRERKGHVLLLAYYFPPLDSAGYSIRAVKFVKHLVPWGWDFTVIAGDPTRSLGAPGSDSSRYLLEEVPDAVDVVRVPAPVEAVSVPETGRWSLRDAVTSPFADALWMRRVRRAALQVAAARPVDAIFATAPPFTTPVLGAQLRNQLGVPLVLDFRDDWVDTPVFFAKPGWHRLLHRRLERRTIGVASRVLVPSEASQQHLQERFPRTHKKFVHLPNGWDPEDLPPQETPAVTEHFVISTAGGYRRADRSPEWLLRAVGRLAGRRSDVRSRLRLRFFGSWLRSDFTDAELSRLGVVDLVEEVPPVPKVTLMEELRDSELLVAIPTAYWSRSIPGKLYEYWALGKAPILLLDDPSGAPARFLRTHELGSVVAATDTEAIERTVERHFDAWAQGAPIRIGRDGVERFDRRGLAVELGRVLEAVMDEAAP